MPKINIEEFSFEQKKELLSVLTIEYETEYEKQVEGLKKIKQLRETIAVVTSSLNILTESTAIITTN